jgi:hypothetical protein
MERLGRFFGQSILGLGALQGLSLMGLGIGVNLVNAAVLGLLGLPGLGLLLMGNVLIQ